MWLNPFNVSCIQSAMDWIFSLYLDDILVAIFTKAGHKKHLFLFFKIHFSVASTDFLGRHVDQH